MIAPGTVKCLLVDDLEDNLLALSVLLRGGDIEVFTARSGPEALELLLVHDFALALLDVQMPGMDGFQLAELMRGSERTRGVPIIFLTAGARDQYRLFKGYEAGAVDFMFKPVDAHILRNKAEVFFELHRQRQLLAAQLRERTETLRLNEMLVAVLGHDLRSPLGAMTGFSELILRVTQEERTRDLATRMLASGQRMARMVDEILDLARARLAGGIPVQPGPVDFGALVARGVQEQETAAPGRRIELTTSGDLQGVWDGDRLAQVVSNLVGNALAHGREGAAIAVAVDGTQADRIVLTVGNEGEVPADLLPRLFDPFQGGNRRKTKTSRGLGLGLYIVQQIVQAHGGSITAQAADDRTTFRVELPREPSALRTAR